MTDDRYQVVPIWDKGLQYWHVVDTKTGEVVGMLAPSHVYVNKESAERDAKGLNDANIQKLSETRGI